MAQIKSWKLQNEIFIYEEIQSYTYGLLCVITDYVPSPNPEMSSFITGNITIVKYFVDRDKKLMNSVDRM